MQLAVESPGSRICCVVQGGGRHRARSLLQEGQRCGYHWALLQAHPALESGASAPMDRQRTNKGRKWGWIHGTAWGWKFLVPGLGRRQSSLGEVKSSPVPGELLCLGAEWVRSDDGWGMFPALPAPHAVWGVLTIPALSLQVPARGVPMEMQWRLCVCGLGILLLPPCSPSGKSI